MRITFRFLFVGWWMAVQKWMAAGQDYHRPSIFVSPPLVSLGGSVTIRCSNTEEPRAKFILYTSHSSRSKLPPQTARGYEARFTMSNMNISDAGSYQCYYCPSSGDPCSHLSDAVHINVTDPSIPKPSIKVKPGQQQVLHSNIAVECQGREDGLSFSLRKEKTKEVLQVATATGSTASFDLLRVKAKDAGSYICQYHHRSNPFVWSEPSDPLELTVRDPGLSKPSIQVSPEGQHDVGANITIECRGTEDGLNFSLHKSKNSTVIQRMKARGDTAKFSLPPLRPEDEGNYTCQYYRKANLFVSSEPSDPVQVVVTACQSDKKGSFSCPSFCCGFVHKNSPILWDHTQRHQVPTPVPGSMWKDTSPNHRMTIIWASAAAGLLLVLLLLVLILVLCTKRRKRSTVKEENQPMNKLLEQNAGMGQDDREEHDGVTYAVLKQHSLKTEQPASRHAGPESCVYATVANEKTRKV